jgi:hypothetical protein
MQQASKKGRRKQVKCSAVKKCRDKLFFSFGLKKFSDNPQKIVFLTEYDLLHGN